MLATLSVVREKDLGSIINFYVTPTTRLEFLLGKQLRYVALGFLNFLLLMVLAVTLFDVPLKGDFLTAAAGALLYVGCSTGIGLLVSTLTRTQVAALFATAVLTLIPASNFCGLTDPVSSLEGFGRLVGDVYPTSLLHHDLPRDLQQGAGFRRPVRVVHPPADRHPGADRAERGVLEETGDLSHARQEHPAPGRQGTVEPGPRPDHAPADRLRLHGCRSIRPRARCRTRSTRRRSPSWTRTSRRCRSGSSTPSSRRCSCRRSWCRGRRWTPGWTPGWTPSPSTSPPTSSRTCWPGARPRSSSTPTRPASSQAFSGSGYVQTIVHGRGADVAAALPDHLPAAGGRRGPGAVQPEPDPVLVRRRGGADRHDHHAVGPAHRFRPDPRARARHGRAPAGDAGDARSRS